MIPLRRRINPHTFVITLRQIAKHLKISQERILNWEKWHNVLWVHIQGLGGYFISYRKLEQWLAACRTLIRGCYQLISCPVHHLRYKIFRVFRFQNLSVNFVVSIQADLI